MNDSSSWRITIEIEVSGGGAEVVEALVRMSRETSEGPQYSADHEEAYPVGYTPEGAIEQIVNRLQIGEQLRRVLKPLRVQVRADPSVEREWAG